MRLSRPLQVAAFVIAIAALGPSVALATAQQVVIKDFSFGPQPTTISVGESVTWINNGLFNHTATSDNGKFDTGAISANANATISFALAGSYAYHCAIHPTLMKGTIVVLGPTATPAPPTPTPPPQTPPPTLPPTAPPTASPASTPSSSASGSASPSPSASPTPTPTATGTPITVPTNVALASPSAQVGPGPDLGSGPGPVIAGGALLLAIILAGSAFYLYRRR